MKKVFVASLCILLSLSLLLCGCNKMGGNPANSSVGQAVPASTQTATTTTAPTTTTTTASTTTTTATTAAQPANEFNRPWSPSFVIQDQYSIFLGHAHWEGNKLILRVYVTNGYDHRIVETSQHAVHIKDSKGNIIAKTTISFENYVLEVNQYRTETYALSGNEILIPNANLNDDQLDIWFIN